MELKELLFVLEKVAKKNKIATPYIVGGVPRNIILGKNEEIRDIDITTGYSDVFILGDLFAQELGHKIVTEGKHKKMDIGGLTFDFSTNFKYNTIDKMLDRKGIHTSNELLKETYCRDFTANTLLLDLKLNKIIDLTKHGVQDCKDLVLNCPVNPTISFFYDPKRILRAFLFKAKYNFQFSESVDKSIKANVRLLKLINKEFTAKLLNKILEYNADVIEEMIDYDIFKYISSTKAVNDELIKRKRIIDLL